MNLLVFPLLCLTILVQQTICQDEAYKKYSCDHDDMQTYIIDRHNELRKQVKPAPSNMLKMVWDKEAAKNALHWALQCKHAHSKAPQRETSTFSCGENLYMSNRLHSWNKVIQGWFDEHQDFTYGTGAKTQDAVIGHYTQLVWYKSYLLGCAVAYCPNQPLIYYYVCHYCPAGNSLNSLNAPYEAGDECALCPNHCTNGLCHNACPYVDDYTECPEYKELCNEDEEDMSEEDQIKSICKETCNCDEHIH